MTEIEHNITHNVQNDLKLEYQEGKATEIQINTADGGIITVSIQYYRLVLSFYYRSVYETVQYLRIRYFIRHDVKIVISGT